MGRGDTVAGVLLFITSSMPFSKSAMIVLLSPALLQSRCHCHFAPYYSTDNDMGIWACCFCKRVKKLNSMCISNFFHSNRHVHYSPVRKQKHCCTSTCKGNGGELTDSFITWIILFCLVSTASCKRKLCRIEGETILIESWELMIIVDKSWYP